jgi:hypothetical protein
VWAACAFAKLRGVGIAQSDRSRLLSGGYNPAIDGSYVQRRCGGLPVVMPVGPACVAEFEVRRVSGVAALAGFAWTDWFGRVWLVWMVPVHDGLDVSLSGEASCALEHEKGIRWMPWHQEAMKDVARCEKPRGAASRR